MAWILEAQSAIDALFSDTGYLAPFTILVLCGFGLPIPEEITMIGSGFLLYQGEVEALPMILVCIAGTLIGDSVPFYVGRHYGRRALRHKVVRRAVHPERLRAIERRFQRHGALAVFMCRFVPGLRLPAWFTAGTLGMPYLRFIAIDALGAAIMTPVFVLLGRASGEKIAELEGTVENLHQILGFVALALAATLIGHLSITRRWPTAARRAAASAEADVEPEDVTTADFARMTGTLDGAREGPDTSVPGADGPLEAVRHSTDTAQPRSGDERREGPRRAEDLDGGEPYDGDRP